MKNCLQSVLYRYDPQCIYLLNTYTRVMYTIYTSYILYHGILIRIILTINKKTFSQWAHVTFSQYKYNDKLRGYCYLFFTILQTLIHPRTVCRPCTDRTFFILSLRENNKKCLYIVAEDYYFFFFRQRHVTSVNNKLWV